MTADAELLEDSAEELFEDAPCGYLSTRLDGTIVKVNRTFEAWTGFSRAELLERRRFQDLLTPGGRIYHETHYAPLLQMQGSVREIAVELVRADGTRLPALVNSVLRRDATGQPRIVRTTVFDATERRSYERELLRARRQEHEIAHQLQRSLLSGALPQADEVELDVAYRPGVSGLEVGGDWYDAFWLEEGRTIGFVVGDVVGRGIGAAATMGQLRSAVRALASTGLGPAALLEALDAYVRRHEVGEMTTLVCGRLDLATRELRHACAGHPPPAIAPPDGPPVFAWDGRSLPLGTAGGPRAEAVRRLPPGSTVVLYTDGLVERRTRPLAERLDQLLAAIAAIGRARPEEGLAEALVGMLADTTHSADDVCVLTVTGRASSPPTTDFS